MRGEYTVQVAKHDLSGASLGNVWHRDPETLVHEEAVLVVECSVQLIKQFVHLSEHFVVFVVAADEILVPPEPYMLYVSSYANRASPLGPMADERVLVFAWCGFHGGSGGLGSCILTDHDEECQVVVRPESLVFEQFASIY